MGGLVGPGRSRCLLDVLNLKYQSDTLSGNVGKKATYAAQEPKKGRSQLHSHVKNVIKFISCHLNVA